MDAQKYKPWGEVRQLSGELPTDRTFQGQRDSGCGLSHFGARWFDSYLNRWTQPDSILPDYNDPQSFDRYAFVRNNPVNRIDPTGHMDVCPDCEGGGSLSAEEQLEKLRVLRDEDRNQNSEVPFDTSLGENNVDEDNNQVTAPEYRFKWEILGTDWIELIHIAEMAGATVFVAGITVAIVPIVLTACLTPVSCVVGVGMAVPVVLTGGVATTYLAIGTWEVFKEEFFEEKK